MWYTKSMRITPLIKSIALAGLLVGTIAFAETKLNQIGSVLVPAPAGNDIGQLMSPPYINAATATTTSGSLATSSIVTFAFKNGTSTNATATVATTYYFEVAASENGFCTKLASPLPVKRAIASC